MKLTRQHWARASEFGFVLSFAAAVAIVVNGVANEPTAVPPARPILAPIASLATTYCPDRLEVFELRLAQEACFEMALATCQGHGAATFWGCFDRQKVNCEIGNTQERWAP